MTGSQYKNIIDWTFKLDEKLKTSENRVVIKRLLDNMGTSFPTVSYEEALNIFKNQNYLGWRNCPVEDAQTYSNLGIPTIAVDKSTVILIYPDATVSNMSFEKGHDINKNESVKTYADLTEEQINNMNFFSYRYGFEIEKNNS